MKQILGLVVGLGMGMAMPAYAVQPSDASLDRLVEVTHVEDNMVKMLTSSEGLVGQMMQSLPFPKDGLTPKQSEQVQRAIERYALSVYQGLNTQQLRTAMIDIFKTTAQSAYTQEEVDAQIQFFSTPVGQRVIEKQPQVYQAYMAQIMPVIMQKSEEKAAELLPQLIEEVEKIVEGK